MRVDVQSLDCDFYVLSGHKLFAPTGIGVVYGKSAILDATRPWQGGGNMIQDVTFEKTITTCRRPFRGRHRQPLATPWGWARHRLPRPRRNGEHCTPRNRTAALRYGGACNRPRPAHHRHGARKGAASSPSCWKASARRKSAIFSTGGIAVRAGHHCGATHTSALRHREHGARVAGTLQHLRGHRRPRGALPTSTGCAAPS